MLGNLDSGPVCQLLVGAPKFSDLVHRVDGQLMGGRFVVHGKVELTRPPKALELSWVRISFRVRIRIGRLDV